jgi:hypothetical protein
MSTIKDIKYISSLHRDLVRTNKLYRISKSRLRSLMKTKKDCYNSGYIQHYPEFNSMISDQLLYCRTLKKQLRVTADTLRKTLYEENYG